MEDINQVRQNHPELVVRDIEHLFSDMLEYVPPIATRYRSYRHILKRRGVNKWLRVRRMLINLKDRWRERIRREHAEMAIAKSEKDWRRYLVAKGRADALADCRAQVRALCHSPRDVDWPTPCSDFSGMELPADFPRRPGRNWFRDHAS